METLQEYLVYTKGWEYILTIAFVLVFIGLWRILGGSEEQETSEGATKGTGKV